MLQSTRTERSLLRQLLLLALPVFAEHTLHILVGVTDTYLANHLLGTQGVTGTALKLAHDTNAAAGAAVGSIAYITWFIGLIVSSIGTGATAIIARSVGARHRRLANKVCGQSILCSSAMGVIVAIGMYLLAEPIAHAVGLHDQAGRFFVDYIRILVIGLPFAVIMFTANACLRGSGDTVTPAAAMITVDIVNFVLTVGLTYGVWYMPELGFRGIAIGTSAAYITGGLLQLVVLLIGRKHLKLFVHRLRPDFHTIKRIVRIGIPAGSEGLLWWIANFAVVSVVNRLGNESATAHNLAIRVESFSFMSGMAIGTAVATLVGQNLGARNPDRARRAVYLGYGIGGGMMVLLGFSFIAFSGWWATLFTDDPAVQHLTAQCLFRTGFIQCGMAGSIIFGSALRGAGDTMAALLSSVGSVIVIRCGGVLIAQALGADLPTIWLILCLELLTRGILLYSRFASGKWVHAKV